MKILYVTSYPLEYNTSANIRNLGLIQGFLENGHIVSTFSAYPVDKSLYSGELLDMPFAKRYWVGPRKAVSVNTADHKLLGKLKGLVYKTINNLMVYDRRYSLVEEITKVTIEEKYDIVVSSSDPKSAHAFAEKIIKTYPDKVGKWIQYWGDPFTNDISNNHRFSLNRIKREEYRLLSIADKVVYVSPFTRQDMVDKYPEFKEKIDFYPIPFMKKERNNKQSDVEKGLIGYLGDYSSKNRNILPFVEAVKKLNVKAVIAGSSDLVLESTNALTVKGRLHGKEIDKLAERVGVYVCVCNLYGTQIPGKVYHYVDTGKPILIILDGDKKQELRKYFESFSRFYLCENEVNEICGAINNILLEYHDFATPDILQAKFISQKFLV